MKNLIVSLFLIFYCGILYSQKIDSVVFNEVVVSGNKSKINKLKVVQTIDKIKSEDIKLSQSSNTAQTLQNTGMITVQKSQNGGGSPIVRGFEANRVLIVVDGVRMNNAIFRSGHLQNVLRINNSMIENIEILYGPSSTIYGSDALGGTLVFNTRKPKFNSNKKIEVSFNYGSANSEKNASLIFSKGGEKWASITSFTLADFGNLRMGSMFIDNNEFGKRNYYQGRVDNKDTMILNDNPLVQKESKYSQYDFLQKFSFLNNINSTHSVNIQYSTSTDVPRYDRLTDIKDEKFTNAEWYYGPERRLMIGYIYDHYLEKKLSDRVKVNTSYQLFSESRHVRRWNDSNKLNQVENVHALSVDAISYKKINTHNFTFGLEYIHNIVHSGAEYENIITHKKVNAITRYAGNGSYTIQPSIYFQDILTITPNTSFLNYGLRASFYHLESNLDTSIIKYPFDKIEISTYALTGNLGLNLKFAPSSLISLNTSTGFRSPNVDDMSKIFDNSNFITINQGNLKPERTINFEIKYLQNIDNIINFEIGAYYTRLYDVIVSKPSTFDGDSVYTFLGQTLPVYSLKNEENGYITGYYGRMIIDLLENLKLKAQTNFTYGRTLSINGAISPLDHIPPMSSLVSISYKDKNLISELSFQHNSSKESEDYRLGAEDNERYSYDPINGYMPSWYIINFNSSYNINRSLKIYGGIDNIFDRNYRVFASGIQASGRNVKLGLRAEF